MSDEARRARLRLAAQNGAARALMESPTPEAAVEGLLAAVCQGLEWTVGAFWRPSGETGPLRRSATWAEPSADVEPFMTASRETTFEVGMGLPGRVFGSGESAWIRDVDADSNFPRQEAARASGLRGGFAVPVSAGGERLGVLEFFTRQLMEPDPELLETMNSVGSQLGQFVQRSRTEAALRESEAQFRAFIGTVPDATFTIDESSVIVFVNDAARSIFGYSPEELVGQPLTMLIPERQRALHRDGVEHYIRTGERRISWDGIELPGLHRDGTEVPLEITFGTYVRDGRRFFTGIARDISERRQVEDRVRFQAHLLDAVAEAVIATDLDGRILYWNAFAEQLYGWKVGEVMGRDIAEITPTEIGQELAGEIMERLRSGEPWSGEFMVRDRGGREFPVLVHDSPIEDDAGRLIGIIGTSTEITDRKRSEQGQRFLARAGTALASSLDYSTTLHRVAELAVPMLGDWCLIHAVEDTGELGSVARAVPDADADAAAALEQLLLESTGSFLLDVLRGHEPVLAESPDTVSTLDMERVEALGIRCILAAPLRARNMPLGVLTFARKPTSRPYDAIDVRNAAELSSRAALAIDNARLYRDAELGNRAKADFLAIVSHELRTPLNAITGYADLLKTGVGGELTPTQDQHVDRIKVGARHLAHMVDEILTFARVEAGRERLDLHATDISALVQECTVALQPKAAEKGLELRVEAPEGSLEVLTDPSKVRQVLAHLLSNAVKYTEAGEIVIAAHPHEQGAVVSVRDTGVGISRTDLERVFEPFWQAESPNTRTAGGTGLGLSVGQRIAELLGGSLEVESQPGVGSTFTLRLPSRPPGASV